MVSKENESAEGSDCERVWPIECVLVTDSATSTCPEERDEKTWARAGGRGRKSRETSVREGSQC